MSEKPENLPIGTYVNDPPYLEMRLRMLLTGSAAPSDEAWSGALRVLLHELQHTTNGENILDEVKKGRRDDSPL